MSPSEIIDRIDSLQRNAARRDEARKRFLTPSTPPQTPPRTRESICASLPTIWKTPRSNCAFSLLPRTKDGEMFFTKQPKLSAPTRAQVQADLIAKLRAACASAEHAHVDLRSIADALEAEATAIRTRWAISAPMY